MELQLKQKPMQARNEIDMGPSPSLANEEALSFNDETFELEGSNTYGAYFRRVVKEWTNLWHFKCEICMEDFDSSESSCYSNCKHNHFCHLCLFKYVKFKLIFFEEICCPKEGCNAKLDTTCKFFQTLPNSTQKRYIKMSQSYQKLRDANFRVCPSEKCLGNIVFNKDFFKCNTCKDLFCLNCLDKKHDGQCYQLEIAFFQNILHFRRCPNCKFIIQKREGCDHMTCVCKYQFCYKCNDAYSLSHVCQTDVNNNIIIKNPAAIKKPLLEEERQSSEMDLERNKPQPKKIELFLYYLVLTLILTPFYAVFITGFLMWLAILTSKELLKIIITVVVLVFLGLGPFAIEFALGCRLGKYLLLTVALPLSMLIGILKSFRELFCYITICFCKKYQRDVKKTWKTTFTEPLTT